MVSLTLIVVGFLAVTGGVVALARASTARWERDRRAPVAARADVPGPPPSRAGIALRMAGAVTRRVAAVRSRVLRLPRVRAIVEVWPARTARTRPVRRLGRVLRSSLRGAKIRFGRSAERRSAAPRVDGAGAEPAPELSSAVTDHPASTAGRQLVRRTWLGASRRAPAFLHRHEDRSGARIASEERDESPAPGR
jgi:hypothetical protein